MPRFVVLEHHPGRAGPRALHWDLMLEGPSGLATWACPRPPQPGIALEVRRLDDHRAEYLDFVGTVSGERGLVTRWDAGDYQIERDDDTGLWLRLAGQRLRGLAALRRSADSGEPSAWWLDWPRPSGSAGDSAGSGGSERTD